MIEIILWLVELGRIDVSDEVSVLSRYLVHPQTGHLVKALHTFKYLDIHKDSDLDFNPKISEFSYYIIIYRKIKQTKKMYHNTVKYFQPNDPPPGVYPIQVSCFVDINYVSDKSTRRSQSGIIL